MPYLKDVFEEHLSELRFLWGIWRGALRSPRHTPRTLAELAERMAAHREGLLVAGDDVDSLLSPGLGDGAPGAAFASAWTLLARRDAASAREVERAFLGPEGALPGLRDALCHEGGDVQLGEVVRSGPIRSALAAAEVLAFRGRLDLPPALRERFLTDPDAPVRAAGFGVLAFVPSAVPAERVREGWGDPSPEVRQAARLAAAWARHDGLRAECRTSADPDALWLWAVLARADDEPAVLSRCRDERLGPARARVLGALGSPRAVEALLPLMDEGPDPVLADAAGQAFEKITGREVGTGVTVVLPPTADGGPIPYELLDRVALPDAALAREHWDELRPTMSKGVRWARGRDLSPGADLAGLDAESLWEARLRERFEGRWNGGAADLEPLG